MKEEFFNIDFWRQFVCLIIGVPTGVLVGVVVEALWHNAKQNIEKRQMCNLLIAAFNGNKKLLKQIGEQLANNSIPTFNLDTTSLSAVSSRKYELLDDYELCQCVDTVQFEFTHLARKIDLMVNIFFDPSSHTAMSDGRGKTTSHFEDFFPLLQSMVKEGVQTTLAETDKVLERLTEAKPEII